tara:strand:- start:4287 stop:5345 length:1059 start_codon:yes stop_codon:yes gene_type:complete
MGFFSKIWKGVKKTFKKIGKGIKKAFKSVGKFMGKIGILGNIALIFLTGGLGIGGIFTNFGTALGNLGTSIGGAAGSILKGASWTIGKAAQFGTAVKSGFSTLTKGVTEFFGQTAKYVGNKLNITDFQNAPQSLGEVFSRTGEAVSKQFETFKGDVGDLFTKTSPTLEAAKAGLSYEDYQEYLTKPQTLDEFKQAKGLIPELEQSPATHSVPSGESLLDLPENRLKGDMSPMDIAPPAAKKGFFEGVYDKYSDPQTYIEGGQQFVREAPGAVLKSAGTQLLVNAAMGTPDYDAGPSMGVVSQIIPTDFGAVQQGLTPLPNDGYQEMLFAYDALGQQSGGYGNLYKQRLGAFA